MSIESTRSFIASEFRKARADLRLSQEEVAKRAGCSVITVSRIETENFHSLTYNTICKIAGALGLSTKIILRKKNAGGEEEHD